VNCSHKVPIQTKKGGNVLQSFLRLSWMALYVMMVCIALITQRSVVQIHPPQPRLLYIYGRELDHNQLSFAPIREGAGPSGPFSVRPGVRGTMLTILLFGRPLLIRDRVGVYVHGGLDVGVPQQLLLDLDVRLDAAQHPCEVAEWRNRFSVHSSDNFLGDCQCRAPNCGSNVPVRAAANIGFLDQIRI
jgi:hypothetical protein